MADALWLTVRQNLGRRIVETIMEIDRRRLHLGQEASLYYRKDSILRVLQDNMVERDMSEDAWIPVLTPFARMFIQLKEVLNAPRIV